jgi:hypothetical protein
MNRLYGMIAAGGLLAGAAMAQDEPQQQKLAMEKMTAQVRIVSLQGGVMGKTVKNAPYSGVEVTESTQMLADGTRIHNESQTQVFRDSEGRMRREGPNEITIWDPVANASYVLNPKTQTARKLPMGNYVVTSDKTGPGGDTFTYSVRTSGPNVVHVAGGGPAGADAEEKALGAKLKAEIEAHTRTNVGYAVSGGVMAAPGEFGMTKMIAREKGATEPLGKRTIEGVNSEGTRTVSTTEAGAIGNDRPIQSVSERWFSPDLQTVMMTKHSDPRTGEETFKLINVNRAEPAAYLFQVPAGYQITDQK